jgi:Vam6/Vps39-like protein vacuolar protein sorting-associated protein 39
MAPFEPPGAIVSGFKEKAEALVVQGMHFVRFHLHMADRFIGDRLYIGTSTGNLHIYGIDESPSMSDHVF